MEVVGAEPSMQWRALRKEEHLAKLKDTSVRHPQPKEALRMMLGRQLAKFKECIESSPPKNVRILGIMTSGGCAHGCACCGVSLGPYSKDKNISMEIIEEGRKRGLLRKDVILSGGEALDHPEIVEMVRRFHGSIDVTNGFSGATHKPGEWKRILVGIGNAVERAEISVHALDVWKGESPGRDFVIAHLIGEGYTPVLRVLAELGKEKEAARALFRTIGRLLNDERVRERAKESVAWNGIPFVKLANGSIFLVSQFGRGRHLDGLITERLSIQGDILGFLFEGRMDKVREKLGGTFLMPDGTLISAFMFIDYFAKVKVGSIGDSEERLRANLREELLAFAYRKLGRSVGEFRDEISDSFENINRLTRARIEFWRAFRYDPEAADAIEEVEAALSRCGVEWKAEDVIRRCLEREWSEAAGKAAGPALFFKPI